MVERYADASTVRVSPESRVHFIGIGGAGMAPLAQISAERGMTVSGSDVRAGGAAERLRDLGAVVHVGHDRGNIGPADLVVVSNAVPADNPEWQAAEQDGVPIILRADYLELLMAGRTRVLISGTHGKTTTTSMVTVALQAAGLDPSYAIGGSLGEGRPGAHHGTGEVFVAEADEAFRSFLRLTPDIAIITNLEMDHHDVYDDLVAYRDAFVAFLDRRPPGAPALVCADDPGTRDLLRDVQVPVHSYGTRADAGIPIRDIRPTPDGGSRFTVTDIDGTVVPMAVAVPGRHNVLNAAAAMVAGRLAGGDVGAMTDGLASFTGALRRYQRIGEAAGISIVDDYGHHPTELAATLQAGRQANPDGRVVAVFQPHRYTRTQAMGTELGTALGAADVVIVTEIYAASEPPIPGVDAHLVADAVRAVGTDVRYATTLDQALTQLEEELAPGDLLLTMGAGDITTLGPRVLASLSARPDAGPDA